MDHRMDQRENKNMGNRKDIKIHKEIPRSIGQKNVECWRKARDLSVKIHKLVSNGHLNLDKELKHALKNSTISIMSHIAMGNEQALHQRGYLKHLGYAQLSLVTFRSYLVIIRELGHIGEGDFIDFYDQSIRIADFIDHLINEEKKV